MNHRTVRAVALAVLLVVSAVGVGIGAAAPGNGDGGGPPAWAGPPGHASVPSSNVDVDMGGGPPPWANAAKAAFSASRHSADTRVTFTTVRQAAETLPRRARGQLAERRSTDLAIVIADDVNHEGREVAVSTTVLRDALGHLPQTVHGVHDSGTTWSASIEYNSSASTATFTVPHFSSNTVTFGGTVSLAGAPASDGAQFSYGIDSLDSVSNFTIDMTGHRASEWDNETGSVYPGDAPSISPAGESLRGPSANGNPVLELTASSDVTQNTGGFGSSNRLAGYNDYATGDTLVTEMRVDGSVDTISQMTINVAVADDADGDGDVDGTVDVAIVEETVDTDWSDGTTVATNVPIPDSAGEWTIPLDSVYHTSGDGPYTVRLTTNSATTDETAWVAASYPGDTTYMTREGATDATVPDIRIGTGPATNVSVSADDGTSHSFGDLADGETVSTEFAISTSASSLDFSADGGRYDYALKFEETVPTVDPSVEVNGHTVGHSGTLLDGETVSLSADTAWLLEGTNRVNVSVADSYGADAPTPAVALDYTHTADADQTVDYAGEAWSERYEVTRTWASNREDATLTIPFAGNVVDIRGLEVATNGSDYRTDAASLSLQNTTATIDLGDVKKGETTSVRVNGSKVRVDGGTIQVVDPTLDGDDLDTRFKVTSRTTDEFTIDVSGSSAGDRLHYLVSESWPSTAYSTVGTSSNVLHMPNASVGGTATVRTVPLGASTSSGTTEVRVEDPDEPRVSVTNSDGVDILRFTYHDTVSGERYVLWDVDDESEVDAAVAQSPVVLETDGAADTYVVKQTDASGMSGAIGGVAVSNSSGPVDTGVLFGGLFATVLGAVLAGRRLLGWRSPRSMATLAAAGLVVGTVGAEAATSTSVLGDLLAPVTGVTGGSVGPVVIVLGVLGSLWGIHTRTGVDVPRWFWIAAGLALGVWFIEQMSPGALLGGLERISPVVWFAVLGGGALLAWRALKPTTISIRGMRK